MDANSSNGRRVLVVDDEPYVCDAIKMVLELDGHAVTTACSGAQALEAYAQNPYDLVITDYSMPGMKGDELAAQVKSRNPSQSIIMISAFVEKLTGEGTPLVNVRELIGKPFRLDEIKQAVDRAFSANGHA